MHSVRHYVIVSMIEYWPQMKYSKLLIVERGIVIFEVSRWEIIKKKFKNNINWIVMVENSILACS